jgi:hypothetical protein
MDRFIAPMSLGWRWGGMDSRLRLAFAVLLAVLLLTTAAGAARAAGPEVGVADDRLLLVGGADPERVVAEWRANGVDVVRIFALWSQIAPSHQPAGFDGANQHAPGYTWGRLDEATRRVRGAGIKVMLTITGPGPVWTSRSPGRGNPRYTPDPARYAAFATAVASRYGADVDRYILWNEPNLPSWLQPQARCADRRCTPVAPHLYRGLVRAAYPAIKAADPGAEVLIGAMSSRGLDLKARNSTLRPLMFLRALGCVSRSFGRRRQPPLARPPRVGARPAAARRAAARDDAPLQPLPRRVRLPDAAARQDGRRLARDPGPLAAARGLPRLARPARAAAHAVPVVRRAAAARGQRVRRLAVGHALPLRPAEAGAGALRHADAGRRGAQPAVGPGAAGRRADGDRRAAVAGGEAVRRDRPATDGRARLLVAEAAAHSGRSLPLPDRGGDERELPPLRTASASSSHSRWSSSIRSA